MPKKRPRRGPDAIRARLARRRRLRLIGIPVLALLVLAGAIVYRALREDPRPPAGTNLAEDLSDGPLRIVYADFGDDGALFEQVIDGPDASELGTLPVLGETIASPASSFMTIEWWDNDAEAPKLTVFDPSTGDRHDIEGFATEPRWHPTGDRLAYAEPLDLDLCTIEDCEGDSRIHVFDPVTGETELFQDAGPWEPRFWAGDRFVIQDDEDNTTIHLVGRGDEVVILEIMAMAARGASPDGRWLLVSQEGETAFYPLGADGHIDGEPVEVELAEERQILTGVEWAHDSSAVVAALLGGGGRRPIDVVLISPDDPELRSVGEIDDRISRLHWTPDNSGVVITKVSDTFEALHCNLDREGEGAAAEPDDCTVVLDWTTGLAPLRVEGSA